MSYLWNFRHGHARYYWKYMHTSSRQDSRIEIMDRLLRVPPSKVQPNKIQRWSDYLFKFCGKKTINRSLESCSTHLKAAVEHKGTIHQPFLRWVSAEGGPFDQHGEGGCAPVQGEKGLAWTRALHLEQSMAPATRNQTLGLAASVMVRVALHGAVLHSHVHQFLLHG